MKKINFLILSAICVLFASCGENLPKSDEKNGSVTISLNGGSRTIGPNVRWSLNEIISWNVKFTDMDDDSEYAYTKAFQSASETFSLPVGNYSVYIEGKYNLPDTQNLGALTVCGSANNIVVTANQKSTAVVAVALSKTGTGTFEYNLSFDSAFEFSDDTKFVVSLYPTVEGGLSPCLDAFYDEEKGCVQFFMENIASGYYFMSVSYTIAGVEYFISIPDVLVEIADGTVTSASYLVTDASTVKTFYVKHDDSLTENGITPDHPASFTKVMNWLSKNKKSWTKANLYCLEKSADATGSVSVSEIDVDSDYCAADQQIVYYESFPVENSTLVTSEYKEVWSLTKDNFNVSQKTDFSFKSNCGTEVVLYYERAAGNAGNFILDNVTLSIKNIISPNFFESSKIYIKDAKASDSAFMVGEYLSGTVSAVPSLVGSDFKALDELQIKAKLREEEYSGNSRNYEFFVSNIESAGVTFSEAVPLFTVYSDQLTDGVFSFNDNEDSKITFKASASNGNSFNNGTSFEWYLNGNKLSETSEKVVINVLNESVNETENYLYVKASYNGSSKTFVKDFNVKLILPYYVGWSYGYNGAIYYYGNDPDNLSYLGVNNINDFDFNSSDDSIYVSSTDGIYHKTPDMDDFTRFIESSSGIFNLSFDNKNKQLYYIFYNSESQKFNFGVLDLSESVNDSSCILKTEDNGIFAVSKNSVFAAYNDSFYIISEVKPENEITDYQISKYSINFSEVEEGTVIVKKCVLAKAGEPVSIGDLVRSTITDFDSLVSSNSLFRFTDILVNDEGVFVLLRNVSSTIKAEKAAPEENIIYSRGAVLSLNSDLTACEVIGWNPVPSKFEVKGKYVTDYEGSTDNNNLSFFGPQKFIALQPKKLIIADDGSFIYANYQSSDGSSALYSKDRVVTFNLKTKTLTADSIGCSFDDLTVESPFNTSSFEITTRQ